METRRIEPQRLDKVLLDTRTTTTEPVTRALAEEFEAMLHSRTRRRSSVFASASLRDEMIDFIMPRLEDSGIFQSRRYVEILESLLKETLPVLDEDEEVRSVAAAVIADEIDRLRTLQARIVSETAE